jgi:phosphopantothenoylcysteine synthetase/decarboxylase
MYMQMQLWTLLHNSSHSIKDPNQTNIIKQAFKHIDTYKNSFVLVFVPKSRSPIPKGHFRYEISKCEIHICL